MTSCSFCLTPTRRLSLLQALDQAKASPRSLPLSISPPCTPGGEVRSLPHPLAPGRLAFPGAPSPVTSSSRASLGRELPRGSPVPWYSQVYSPAWLDVTSGRWNSARPSVESGDWTISQTRPPFLRAKLTFLVGAPHRRVTELRAGTTEPGQALREGLGSASGRKRVSGLGAPHPPALGKPKEGRGKCGSLGGKDQEGPWRTTHQRFLRLLGRHTALQGRDTDTSLEPASSPPAPRGRPGLPPAGACTSPGWTLGPALLPAPPPRPQGFSGAALTLQGPRTFLGSAESPRASYPLLLPEPRLV